MAGQWIHSCQGMGKKDANGWGRKAAKGWGHGRASNDNAHIYALRGFFYISKYLCAFLQCVRSHTATALPMLQLAFDGSGYRTATRLPHWPAVAPQPCMDCFKMATLTPCVPRPTPTHSGIMSPPQRLVTRDGLEMQFQVCVGRASACSRCLMLKVLCAVACTVLASPRKRPAEPV